VPYVNPSVAEFKDYFFRDFPFGSDPETQVVDQDVTRAFQQTNIGISQKYFTSQASYTVGYNLLSAFYLVQNLQASSQGINGQYSFLEQSKSVGNVSQSFALPEAFTKNPFFAMLVKNNYGAQYFQMIYPQLVGTMYTVRGRTRP
jgi:hypothetical protein